VFKQKDDVKIAWFNRRTQNR